MSLLIDFFSFLWRVLSRTLSFLVSLPGMVVSGFISLGTAFSGLLDSLRNHATNIISIVDVAINKVEAFSEWVESIPIFSILSHMTALDVLYTSLHAVAMIFFSVFGLVFTMGVIWLVVLFIPFFLARIVSKIAKTITAGFVST